ncbi:MAG: TolB family protein, partial [Actinomycetota bacterium]
MVRTATALVLMVALVGGTPAPPAGAAFPGANGKIAFRRDTTGTGTEEIFSMNADGSGQTNLTNNNPADDQKPDWSPDGTRVAFYT